MALAQLFGDCMLRSVSRFSQLFLIATAFLSLMSQPAMATSDNDHNSVSAAVTVNARPGLVFEAIRMQRTTDPARKVISSSGNEIVIDEHFHGLPVIGRARCTYKEIESPPERLEYCLIDSDKFKTFAGSWTLSPSADGQSTEVRLTTSLETGLRLPFAKQLTNTHALKDVQRRLHRVKTHAEEQEKRVRSVAKKD